MVAGLVCRLLPSSRLPYCRSNFLMVLYCGCSSMCVSPPSDSSIIEIGFPDFRLNPAPDAAFGDLAQGLSPFELQLTLLARSIHAGGLLWKSSADPHGC